MNLADIQSALPDYAKDLRRNLESVLGERGAPGLDDRQVRAVALASAVAARHAPLTAALDDFAAAVLGPAECAGARTAAAIMGMTNVYYRFTHSVANREYQAMRTGLRMNAMHAPGLDKASFELCALAVSAINGCGACVDSHEARLRAHGVTAQGVQSAVRIAAVVHAVAVTLEQARA